MGDARRKRVRVGHRTGLGSAIVVVALASASCSGAEGAPSTTEPAPLTSLAAESETTTTTQATTTTHAVEASSTTAATSTTVAVAVIDGYLNEFYVLDQALEGRFADFEETFNSGYFEEHGEPQTEEASLDYARSFWVARLGPVLDHVDAVASLEAPPGFVEAQSGYVSTYRAYVESIVTAVEGAASSEEFQAVFEPLFDPFVRLPDDLHAALVAYVPACSDLEEVAADAGFKLDLDCPPPPLYASTGWPAIEIEDTEWTVAPAHRVSPYDQFPLTVINRTDTDQPFVVVRLNGIAPEQLPVAGGLLDLSAEGPPGSCEDCGPFEIVYSTGDEGIDPPAIVGPGEEITVRIGGVAGGGEPAHYVVVSHRPGGYESGSFAAFILAAPADDHRDLRLPSGQIPQLYLVVAIYTALDDGECAGSGELAGMAEGLPLVMSVRGEGEDDADAEEIAELELPPGRDLADARNDELAAELDLATGCAFLLRDPAGLELNKYAELLGAAQLLFLLPESGPVDYETVDHDDRLIIVFGG